MSNNSEQYATTKAQSLNYDVKRLLAEAYRAGYTDGFRDNTPDPDAAAKASIQRIVARVEYDTDPADVVDLLKAEGWSKTKSGKKASVRNIVAKVTYNTTPAQVLDLLKADGWTKA